MPSDTGRRPNPMPELQYLNSLAAFHYNRRVADEIISQANSDRVNGNRKESESSSWWLHFEVLLRLSNVAKAQQTRLTP